MNGEKAGIREKYLSLRNSMPEIDADKKSLAIINRLISTAEFEASSLIMCYASFGNEVRTGWFIRYCLDQGIRIAVPVIEKAQGRKEIFASEVFDADRELVAGTWGIPEPRREFYRRIKPEDIDTLVIPGVAFDFQKNRIGFGAGYYDRFLTQIRRGCIKIGVAYELQLQELIPVCGHDVRMDIIITEGRIIR